MAAAATAEAALGREQEEGLGLISPGAEETAGAVTGEAGAAPQPRGEGKSRRVGRRLLLLAPAALASAALAVWCSADESTQQEWRRGGLQGLWLFRHDDPTTKHPESVADCVFDSQFAVENTIAFGLAVNGAANSCPAAKHATDLAVRQFVQGTKHAHEARITALFGAKEEEEAAAKDARTGALHSIAENALKKVRAVMSQFPAHKAPRVQEETKAQKHMKKVKATVDKTLEETKASADAFVAAKELTKVHTVQERICAADVTSVLSRLAYVTAAISHLTSECRFVFDQKAYCAGDISRMLAGVTMMASSAAEISASCTKYAEYIGYDASPYEFSRRLEGTPAEEEGQLSPAMASLKAESLARMNAQYERYLSVYTSPLNTTQRRLKGGPPAINPTQMMFDAVDAMKSEHEKAVADAKARDVELTTCVAVSWFAATFFARFLDMSPAVKHCSIAAGVPDAKCAAAVIDIFASLSWATSCISYAVATCPVKGESQDAFCAAGIQKLIASMADTSSALAVIVPTCTSKAR